MHRYTIGFLALLPTIWAQEPLSIRQAVERALQNNGAIEAGRFALEAAGQRIRAARGAQLSQVNYSESWTRSNNQVFAFGSLLTQKQFSSANFGIAELNNPPFLNNFQSAVTVDQVLYDGGRRRADIQAAESGRDAVQHQTRRTELQVIAETVRAYYTALAGQAAIESTRQSVRSAEADLDRAEKRRTAGFITEADVLAIRVHLAAMRDAEIRAESGVLAARAALNQTMGDSLDTQYQFTTVLERMSLESGSGTEAEQAAAKMRPEVGEAESATAAAEARLKSARAALLPEFFLRAGFEADRQRFVTRGGGNWLAAAGMRWNVFSGFSDRARVSEASAEAASRRAMAKYVASGTQVETRRALLDLRSSEQRVQVAGETIKMAEEALRILKNRYEAGLTDVTELIRSETALADARMRYIDAVRDQRLAMLAVELASGTLTKDARAIQ